MVVSFLVLALVLVLYFLPTLVAYSRHTANRNSILVLNLFLGWTFVGWVIFMAMAVNGADGRRAVARAYRPVPGSARAAGRPRRRREYREDEDDQS